MHDRMYSFAILRLCSWNLNFTHKQVKLKNKRLIMFHYQNLIAFAPKLFFYCFHLWRKASEIIMIQIIYLTAQYSPRCKVTQSDATGQTRIYTPSVIWALQRHLVSSEPELGGPLENQVHTGPRLSHTDRLSRQYLHFTTCSGCSFGQSVLPLGVPDPAGLHHDGHAGRPSDSQGGCNHPGCPAGHWLVHSQPDQVAEPRLGTG